MLLQEILTAIAVAIADSIATKQQMIIILVEYSVRLTSYCVHWGTD